MPSEIRIGLTEFKIYPHQWESVIKALLSRYSLRTQEDSSQSIIGNEFNGNAWQKVVDGRHLSHLPETVFWVGFSDRNVMEVTGSFLKIRENCVFSEGTGRRCVQVFRGFPVYKSHLKEAMYPYHLANTAAPPEPEKECVKRSEALCDSDHAPFDVGKYNVTREQWKTIIHELINKYKLVLPDLQNSSLINVEFSAGTSVLKGHRQRSDEDCWVSFQGDKCPMLGTAFLSLKEVISRDAVNTLDTNTWQTMRVARYTLENLLRAAHNINLAEKVYQRDDVGDSVASPVGSSNPCNETVLPEDKDFFAQHFTQYNPTKKVSTMTTPTRNLVNVAIIDPTAGILPEDSLIVSFGERVYDGNEENLKLTIAMNAESSSKLREALTAHNKKRSTTVNLDILERTGNEAFLQPLRIEDVKWSIR